ncbi:MAG TPA: RNA polymerase sigma factor [Sedimentisphaerales bacterium]|nr:RNA polymerase sigma factor [Sedimentisphaerales bacterium]
MAEISTEPDLAVQFRRGDDSAFDRIVARHSAEVAALANRLLGWPGDVDDVVQEVFIAAFLGLRKFRGQCRLRTWLFAITVNKCRSWRLRRRRLLSLAKVDDPEAIAGPDPGSDKAAMDEETFTRVRRAVQALPRKYREVIVLGAGFILRTGLRTAAKPTVGIPEFLPQSGFDVAAEVEDSLSTLS